MDAEESVPLHADAVGDAVRGIAGIAGVLGAAIYVTGYLVVNFYLTQYGVATLNLVESRYFAAGALYLLVSLLVCAAPLASIYTAWQEAGSGRRWSSVALVVAAFALAALVCWAGGIVLVSADRFTPFARPIAQRENSIWLALPASQIALLFPFQIYFAAVAAGRHRAIAASVRNIWLPATLAVIFTVCFLISTVVFSRFVYANASPSVGGVAPIRVQLVMGEGFSSVEGFPLKINSGITEELVLIDHSGSQLVVLRPENNQVIEISESQVMSIIH